MSYEVEAKNPALPLLDSVGTSDTINVYPASFETDDWSGLQSVLSPNLDEDSIFQRFGEKNAAFLDFEPEVILLLVEDVADLSTSSLDEVSETINDEMVPEFEVDSTLEESVIDNLDQEQASTSDVAVYKKATASIFTFFSQVTEIFPFANESTTTEEVLDEEVVEEVDEVLFEAVVEEVDVETVEETEMVPEPVVDEVTVVAVNATTTEDVVEDVAVVEQVSVDNNEEVVTEDLATTTETIEESVADLEVATASSTHASSTEIVESVLPSGFESHSITLSDFSIPELQPGEFITSVQLRASLAARAKTDSEAMLPYYDFVYQTPSSTTGVGTVLVADEVSNALNGGYFLFALPEITEVDDLNDVSIEVVFNGDKNELEKVFLDAVWLEVNTKRITREDLADKMEGDIQKVVGKPNFHDLVSSNFDFSRFEAPVFNLKYNSQRSKPVEAIRSFLGQDKIDVSEVRVLHSGEGLLGVKPQVNVTTDGLVTVAIPDSEKSKLKPGRYTIEMDISEGGYDLQESFDFQWGMLSINTNQTEYGQDELVELSMGALTPNGNTICIADLNLYVVDPSGFVTLVPVEQSGKCDGNNVIDVPDYSAEFTTSEAGEYELFLERVDEKGQVISHTYDTFLVAEKQNIVIERNGPTRIYPPAPYEMRLTVKSLTDDFVGTLVEKVPAGFKIYNTSAVVNDRGTYQELVWDIVADADEERVVSYDFDAPDLSPYLYELGPAELIYDKKPKRSVLGLSTSTASTSEEIASSTNELDTFVAPQTSLKPAPQPSNNSAFLEHRQWQIASDATGNMIILWDGANIPTNWTCLSCGSGTFYQRFAVGSSTYNNTGGTATHTPSATGSVNASTASDAENFGSGTVAGVSHTHTYTPTISGETNLPNFRNLRFIQYTAGAGEPAATSAITSIPTGAIGIFDVASSSLPSGWVRYAAQDGYYVRGADNVGVTGGANTHVHDITGNTGAAAGSTEGARGGGTAGSGAAAGHTHAVLASTTVVNNEPPYIEVVLAQLTATSSAPNDLITMWTEDVPSGWIDVSSDGADPFNNRFIKASTTYGATGGANTHTHADVTGITSQGPSGGSVVTRTGTFGAAFSHTHNVDVTGFSTDDQLPPFTSVVFGKRQGTNPVYEQLSFRWYANENAQTPTDPWPSGASNLKQGEPITATTTVLGDGDVIRLRINAEVTNATSTAGTFFKLQYAPATNCSVASWSTVGDTSSSTAWRGYDNSSVTDHGTLSSTTLSSTTVAETYEENGYATATPNQIPPNDIGEWDFVLQNNGAATGTTYCFRMIENDGSAFNTYTLYPKLVTDSSPDAPTLSKLFDNEKTASTTISFQFVTSDTEGEDLHYQVQIDDDYNFGSTVEDRNSISNSSQFTNLVVPSDKAPFTSGQLMEFDAASSFTNGTTYYWRVRAQDPNGSNSYGDWSEIRSFTIDTSLTASAWFQTETEQFDTNTLEGIDTASDQMDLASGSTTGTTTSSAITFTDGSSGTAWDSLTFNDIETNGDVKYVVQYQTDAATWANIPDSDLTGNSSGFDTSPVNLLGLDTDDYGVLRIVARLNDIGGTPSVQDWTVNWGYRVETPTITKLFPNEKVGTTTPIFEFTTTDPQSDDLTYEISWSTTTDFSASTTRNSTTTPAGFTNIDSGADTSPFNSGDTIQYEIQTGDALTNNETYWWRVRAKDPNGDDAWSFWTDIRSFTVDTTVVASTWFQTTEEQFDTNVLSGTVALATDAVGVATTATEAILVYGEGTATTPKYRQWDGSSWSAESDMEDIGAALTWARVKAGTTREEYVAITIGTDSDANAQVFSTGAWGDTVDLTTNVGDITGRGVDIAYETQSGDAMVVYCDNAASPSYRIWNGTTWNTEASITVSETTNCEWVELASDPVSDEIILLVRGTDGNPYEAQVWSGSAWGNSTTLGNITEEDFAGMAVEYEESGGQALVVTSDGNPARFEWNSWNGTTWGTSATFNLEDDFEWGSLVQDIGSDELALCYQDEDTNIGTARWGGASWAAFDEHLTTTGKSKADPGFACVFEDGGSRDNYIMTVFTDADSTEYSYWDNSVWSTATTITAIGSSTITSQLERTGDGTIIGIFFDETDDELLAANWDGSSWSGTATIIESDASVDTTPYGHPYHLAPRNDGTEGTTIVSPGIDFDDGNGPYWEEMSWVDSTPGTSEILYSVQYQTATGSWEFIPDSEIPGNSAGTTTSPIDLSGLNKNTYNVIRPYAELSCDDSNNCPSIQDWTVEWAEGITISGTLSAYDRITALNDGQIGVAVNGTVQSGKVGSVSGGTWSIANVTTFPGDVVTVFVNATSADPNIEAVGVTRYDGIGDITGFDLFYKHVALGSDDATSTPPLRNADIGLITSSQNEDIFVGYSTTTDTLELCGDTGCGDVVLYINASTTYQTGGQVLGHDLFNNGTLISTSTLYFSGSWDNNATTTLTDSTVVMTATSSTETIDSTGALVSNFNNLTLGTTTGNATWTLGSNLDVDGDLTTERGTLSRADTLVNVAGDLTNGANGVWSGMGTTTFDGTANAIWSDQNSTLQNVGLVVVDGSNKLVTLGSNVLAESITIGADDTLDASAVGNYDITVYTNWENNNVFLARNGTVFFAATTSNHTIDVGGDDFYDLTFSGAGGSWSFVEATLGVDNDFTVSTGTVTMTTGTTTVAGSWSSAGGTFVHNNSVIEFSGSGAETITASGTAFANSFNNLNFTGGGSWTFNDVNATTSNDFIINAGTVTFPSGNLAIGGSLYNPAGAFAGNSGTVQFYSAGSENIESGGSSFSNLLVSGSGTFTFLDTNSDIDGDLTTAAGTLVLPGGELNIGGSVANSATINANSGTIIFDSADTGESVDFGGSDTYNVRFESSTGGWTVNTSATTTNNFVLASSSDFTLSSGQTLSVGNSFTNYVGGASTTWNGSTLYLSNGDYTINTKLIGGDQYDDLLVGATADVKMWNSAAITTTVVAGGSLYSQDHNAVDGDLYIYGDYDRTTGAEYWSYATDFDGTDLSGGSERLVSVYFASGASASMTDVLFEAVGDSAASTTVQNQGAGTYTVSVSGGTTTMQYYDWSDLGSSGLSLLASSTVTTLRDGSFTVAAAGGVALTVSSTTIDANPAKQIYNVTFATTTAISADNVTQTDGAPVSYWWFRDSKGNLDGETQDNDTGNPGSIRWDDSALVLTIAGTVYDDDEVSTLGGTTCDGDVDTPVRVVVQGGTTYDGTCGVGGTYSIGGVTVVGDQTLTVYLNDAPGGEKAVAVTRTPTTDVTNLDLYVDRVITRHEDVLPLSIAEMAIYDSSDDTDISFTAATTSDPDTLTLLPDTELHVWATTTFTPGGTVTLNSGGTGNSWDGSLHIGDAATFTGAGTTTYNVGGSITLGYGATYVPASTTILMTATTSGKTVTTQSGETLNLHNLQFTGVGGGWNLNGNLYLTDDIAMATGTLTGTGDIDLVSGSFSGNGLVSLGGGEVTIASSTTLGGTQGWTFNDLTLGNGSQVGTTTPASNATTTVGGILTIANAHFLDAGASVWDLSGTGGVFMETGNLLEDTSTFVYSGSGAANVISTDYYNLVLSAQGSSPTYTATGAGIQVLNDLTVGGASTTVFTLDTNDPALNVDGDLTITTNGTLIASDTGSFTLAGSYDNNGVFTANSGTLTFDGSGAETIAAGNSVFATALLSGAGDYTVTEHATSMTAFTIGSTLSSFTLDSGQTLSVTGAFSNELGGAGTTWSGSTLHLFGGGNYEINASTTNDVYETLLVDTTTQIRMWNSSATTTTTVGSGSLYSMDHANSDGDLYIFGQYENSGTLDHWSYATDFDGTDLSGGSERQVAVYVDGGDSVTYTGSGQLSVLGVSSASTTVQNQGSGLVTMTMTGTASTTMNYYEFTDFDSDGLTFSGNVDVQDISYGEIIVVNDNDSAITAGGTALDASPALTFTNNIFSFDTGVTTATNVTATGTSVSSWRFTNHTGDFDGEAFDIDPDGDPGYVVWDDSAASITITGTVYDTDESSVSNVCPGATIRVRVAGLTTYDSTCNASGVYSVSSVTYSPGDSIVAYIQGQTENGATVTVDPVSNINNMDIYENRLIVRHESSDPITIDDIAVWDSSDDAGADLFFTAVNSTPDTLTLPANYKLIVWDSKEFEPGGNTTISGGGAGAAYDGTFEMQDGATYTASAGETLSIGGSMVSGAGATYSASTATTTFTTTGAARTIDINDGSFYNVSFTGSGSWSVTDSVFDINNFDMIAGTLTLPTGTTTVSGYFDNSGGTLTHNGSLMVFDGTGAGNTVTFNGSTVSELRFTGSGSWTMDDTDATSTSALTVEGGTLTLPSGTLALGGSFRNEGGAITHNTSHLLIGTSTTATLLASSSDLYAVTFRTGGSFVMDDVNLTLLDNLTIDSGSLDLATGTLTVGGSFDASGGTFTHGSGTVFFNSGAAGETVDSGSNDFYNLVFGNSSGGWTITADATTTNNFTLTNANTFVAQSGVRIYVGGVFDNSVGGTATDWNGSTLEIDSGSEYEINSKSDSGDEYDTLIIGANTDLGAWNSRATTTTVDPTSSFYSMDHAGNDGDLYIYGDYHIATTTEYWSYATDFDGTDISGGSERVVTVSIASGATTTVDGGVLNIVGSAGNETTITNQGAGTYDMSVTAGTFNAQRYAFRNLNSGGLALSNTPVISSLNYGDFELAVSGGRLIDLSSTTLNANASLIITGARFATTSAITGTNVYLTGDTDSAWTFTGHTGNLDGESFDVDGATNCGQVRWDNSSCQLVQQTNYRWRNDDGGLGVPADEWMNTNWDARQSVRIDSVNTASTTDAVIELTVDYDTDMQSDFDDLRFTDSSGTTTVPHFIASTTNSTAAEVWVKVPTLLANDTTVLYMYYNNPTASSTSSSTLTFIAADDFEDNDIAEYTGANDDKSLFVVDGTYGYGSTYGLDNTSNESSRADDGGMARFDQTITQGETIRYMQYVSTNGGDDEVCTLFGVQSPVSNNQNYAVCLEQVSGTDFIAIAEDVVDVATPAKILASTSVTYTDGWYEVEVDWGTDNSLFVSLYDDQENLVATTSATDSSKTSGGYGFTYWFNEGGWDNFSSRPTVVTEPTVRFGAEVADGGATWAAAQDTSYSVNGGETVRLRLAIENSGLSTTTDFGLEYAAKGAAPSCEAVSGASYTDVPNQASCGSSPICMQTTTFYADGAGTTDLLNGVDGDFVAGEAVESPSDATGNLTVGASQYTEVEYTLTPTINATDNNYCMRAGAGNGQLDTYLRVAELLIRFDPSISTIAFNKGDDIALVGGTTTRVYATSSVTDLNGYSDLSLATSTFYHSDVTAACSVDPNSCYIENTAGQCSFTNCAGNSCDLECYADFEYHASPTDSFGGKFWYAFLEVEDTQGGTDFDTSLPQDLLTLNALSVDQTIDYGSLSASSTTGLTNATTSIINIGNNPIDIDLEGNDLTDGGSSVIPTDEQKFATSSFNYDACTTCTNLTTTTISSYELDLVKPTTTASSVEDLVYWGIRVPFGTASNPHTGVNTFYAVSD